MKILICILKIIISLIITLIIAYCNYISSYETVPNIIKILYQAISIFLIVFLIYANVKKLPLYSFFIVIIFWTAFLNIPIINSVFDKDICLDSSVCAEGLEINTEYGLIKVNKENCIKYNWIWDDNTKYCNIRNDKP